MTRTDVRDWFPHLDAVTLYLAHTAAMCEPKTALHQSVSTC